MDKNHGNHWVQIGETCYKRTYHQTANKKKKTTTTTVQEVGHTHGWDQQKNCYTTGQLCTTQNTGRGVTIQAKSPPYKILDFLFLCRLLLTLVHTISYSVKMKGKEKKTGVQEYNSDRKPVWLEDLEQRNDSKIHLYESCSVFTANSQPSHAPLSKYRTCKLQL